MKKRFGRYSKHRITSLLFLPLLTQAVPAHALYTVQKGDSLSGIAKTQYGDWSKWKGIWNLNQDKIKNPDLIYPNQRLKLLSEGELDLYADNSVNPDHAIESGIVAHTNDAGEVVFKAGRNHHSQEWRLLPEQPWETFTFKTDVQIDPDGFDRRSRVAVRIADKTTADITISSDRIPVLGEIINARNEFDRIFLGETVFIRADETLQVGNTYSITTGPQKTISKRDTRVGFGYDITGKIRIIGVRDGVFIGTVTDLYYPIKRHQLLIPNIPAYEFTEPKASANPIAASIVVTKSYQEDMLGEQKLVFLDVGKADGVQIGNVFRHYLREDPNNNQSITSKDYLIEANLQVVAVQEKFSVAVILSTQRPLKYGDEVVSLTNVSDLDQNQGLQINIQERDQPANVDDLDRMDRSEGLGEKESRELKQLEKWSKPAPAAPLTPETATSGSDDVQMLDVHDNPRPNIPIGSEKAPNDGSDKRKQTSPLPTPAPTPDIAAPLPAETPTPNLPIPNETAEAAQGIPAAPVTEKTENNPLPAATPTSNLNPNFDPFSIPDQKQTSP